MEKNKITLLTTAIAGLVLFCLYFFLTPNKSPQQNLPKILISQVIDHSALNETTRGIIAGLAQEGYEANKNIILRVESAQGNQALATQIASKFTGMKPTVVVGVGTMTAQSFIRYLPSSNTKLFFSSVTDPVGAGLISNPSNPSETTTGVSNFVELEPQIVLFKQILPKMKNLGILYNPGEANSVSIVKKLELLCPAAGLNLIKTTINKTGDVAQNATRLAGQVDAIFVSNDNTVLSAIKILSHIATKNKIPVFVSDTDAVELGALAALGPNQFDIGIQTGIMIASYLKGKPVSKIPVEFAKKTELFLNATIAKNIGIPFPAEVITRASKIIAQ